MARPSLMPFVRCELWPCSSSRIESSAPRPNRARSLAFLLPDHVEQLAQYESTKSLPRVAPPWLGSQAGRPCRLIPQLIHPTKAGSYTWAFHDDVEIGPN